MDSYPPDYFDAFLVEHKHRVADENFVYADVSLHYSHLPLYCFVSTPK
jgi:hypothetical protein